MKTTHALFVLFNLVLTLISFPKNASGDLSDERKHQLKDLVDKDDLYDCKYLPLEEKEFLKSYFYEVKKQTNPQAHDYQLLQVGDEKLIERCIREFELTGMIRIADERHSGQARFIEVYAPAMFKNEKLVDSWGDNPRPPLSYSVTRNIIFLLRESPQLSPEVRHWALSLNIDEMEKNRTLLQKWWRANEGYFHERDYAAVRPPADALVPSAAANPSPPVANLPTSTPPPPATTVAATEPAEHHSSFIPSLLTALCALCLAVGYWMYQQRRLPRS